MIFTFFEVLVKIRLFLDYNFVIGLCVARPVSAKLISPSHHGQIDLNKMLGTKKGTHQTSQGTPLGSQITEN